MCKRKISPDQSLFQVFNSLNVDSYKKAVLQERYLRVLDNFNSRSKRLSFAFYLARVIVTVGSILVPAFLSSQQTTVNTSLYWTTWIISIAVSISNGFITLFKLDKKYYFINTTLEMLHSEGWQYVGLSGRYAPRDSMVTSTHENQFNLFFKIAEKIKMRQVEEEFWKFTDTSGVANGHNQHIPILISETPAIRQKELASLSNEKKTILDSWLDDMKNNSSIGLQPREEGENTRVRDRIDASNLDETQGSSRIWKSTSKTPVSMQSQLQETSSSKSTPLQLPQVFLQEDYNEAKDTIIKVMPIQPDLRERTEDK